MGFVVAEAFTDVTDNGYLYKVGDVYPREGTSPTDARIAELLSNTNRRSVPLIMKQEPKRKAPAKKPEKEDK